MAQTGSTLFNNFVSNLTPKKPTTSTPFYPTPTGNAPIPLRNDRQAVGYSTTPAPTARNNFTNNFGKSVVPSNAGATATTPTTITPPTSTTSTLPPAGQQYAQNLSQNGGYSTIPGPYDPATGKLKDTSPSATPTGTPPSSSTTTSGSSPTSTTTTPESPYLTYLKSMFDPEALKTASANSTAANKKLADIQSQEETKSLAGRHASEDAYDQAGGLKAGAIQSAQGIDRRTNRELADLAVQESAAARSASVYKDTYDTLINAGKSVYEAETAAKKAQQDQKNKDKELSQKDTELTETARKNLATEAQTEKKFDEDKRQFGLNYALDAKKVAIEQQKADQTDPNSSATKAKNATDAATSINLINSLLGSEALSDITGSVEQYRPSLLLGAKGNLAKNQYDQVKGMLSLENRSKLKGQGAVSDFEGRVLEQAASSLGRNLSNSDFTKQLKQIRGSIATSHGLTADVLITDPTSKQSQVVNSDSARIAKAIQDGLLIEYQ